MKRREFFKVAGATGGVAVTGSLSARELLWPQAFATVRPNVVVIMTDDQTVSQTSALATVSNQIAAKGATFDRAIDPIPVCWDSNPPA